MKIWEFLRNLVATESDCECHGHLQQMDGLLPDGTPLRIMKSNEGWHVSVWPHHNDAPRAVREEELPQEIYNQWYDS